MNIPCAFRGGGGGGGGGGGVITSVGVSLLGVAHPLWENISDTRVYTDGRISFEAKGLKKADLWLV